MKRSLKDLRHFTVETADGSEGKVRDFLFDEENWIIRYLEVDFGNLFKQEKILIPGILLKEPDWDSKKFIIKLTKENIESSPDLDKKKPVSRQYEEELSKHYNLEYYWTQAYVPPVGAPVYYPPRPLKTPAKVVEEKDVDTSLRSYREVKGYHIKGVDGKLGHVEDMLIDDDDFQIVYLVVDTSNWLPWSKKVILAIEWMENISYVSREVKIDLKKEAIKNAPEYASPVKLDFEKALYDFYSRSFVK